MLGLLLFPFPSFLLPPSSSCCSKLGFDSLLFPLPFDVGLSLQALAHNLSKLDSCWSISTHLASKLSKSPKLLSLSRWSNTRFLTLPFKPFTTAKNLMKSESWSPTSCWYLTTCSFQTWNCRKKEAGWMLKLEFTMLMRSWNDTLHLLVVHCRLSCLQASQLFAVWSHLVTSSWVSPLVFWTRRHPSCMPSSLSWSLSASVSLCSSIGWNWWVSSSVKLVFFFSLSLSLSLLEPLQVLYVSPSWCFEKLERCPLLLWVALRNLSPQAPHLEKDVSLTWLSWFLLDKLGKSPSHPYHHCWMVECLKTLACYPILKSNNPVPQEAQKNTTWEQEIASTKALLPC